MTKLVKEELRPAYYPPVDPELEFKHNPWTKTPESKAIMEKMLDEFEKINSLDETDYDTVHLVKWALWIGFNTSK